MHRAVAFAVMFSFWLLLSGKFDAFHLALGVVSSLIVAVASSDLLFQEVQKSFRSRVAEGLRFVPYTVWLLWQIVVANFHVIGLAVSPRPVTRTLEPHIFSFRTRLQSGFARFVLANSITLTPGTVTIRITGDVFSVHAITRQAAGDLAGETAVSEMERRIARVFEGGGALESFLIDCGVALLLFMFMPLYRVVRGPSVLDRILGVNVIGAKTTVIIVIIGTLYRRVDMFVDIAIAYALLNFIASLAAARLFQRHRQVDVGDDGGGGTC